MKKKIFILVLLVFFSFLGWEIYVRVNESSENNGKNKRKKAVIAVDYINVKKESIKEEGRFTGSLFPQSIFNVSSKISARLLELKVNIGEKVQAGQLIAKLDDEEYQLKVEQEKAMLEVARANVEESESNAAISRRELERIKTLKEKKISSESELDEITARYNADESQVKVAKAKLVQQQSLVKNSEVMLSYTKIHAPENKEKDFYVGEKFLDQGTQLKANDPIISLMNIEVLIAVVNAAEIDYTKLNTGQKVRLEIDAFPNGKFEGSIVRIAPLIVESSRKARIEIEVENKDYLLKPGMFLRAVIVFENHENVPVIPKNAVVKRDLKDGVFLVDEESSSVKFIEVKTGIENNGMIELASGDIEGKIVTLGNHLLEDGTSIIIPELETTKNQKKKSEKNN